MKLIKKINKPLKIIFILLIIMPILLNLNYINLNNIKIQSQIIFNYIKVNNNNIVLLKFINKNLYTKIKNKYYCHNSVILIHHYVKGKKTIHVWKICLFVIILFLLFSFFIWAVILYYIVKNKTKKIKINEERYKTISELISDWVYSYTINNDGSTNVDWITGAFNKITGYKIENILTTEKWISIIHPDDLSLINKQYSKISKEKNKIILEYRIKHKNGNYIWIQDTIQPIWDDKKQKTTRIIGASKDVTKEKGVTVRYRELYNTISNGVAVYKVINNGNDFIFTDINKAAEKIDKINKKNIINKNVLTVFPGIIDFGLYAVFKKVWQTGKAIHHPVTQYKDNRITGWRDNYVYKLPSGEIVAVYEDVTEKKQAEEKINKSLKEKELLLKEIHHRVKNNMQLISSLFGLQIFKEKNEKSKNILQDSKNRIRAMALVHEKLYQSNDFTSVDFKDYIDYLIKEFHHTYKKNNITVNTEIKKIYLSIEKAIPLGLILNELLTNCYKYAFPDNRKGIIKINFNKKKNTYNFILSDNGIGLPDDINLENPDTLGLEIITSLVKQLNGHMNIDSKNGTVVNITF